MNQNTGRIWINFKELRAKLKFADVLNLYDVNTEAKGGQYVGPCPLPGHKGNRGPTSFSAQLDQGIFQCFECKAKGNVLDFAGLMENADISDGKTLRKVATKLQKRFCPEGTGTRTNKDESTEKAPEQLTLTERLNAPLDFELKGLDANHACFENSGFWPATVKLFGAGFCSRGYFAGRIAIPLHDQAGKLIGYAGRVSDDSAISPKNPKYLFPADRERDGVKMRFRKELFLYNGFRQKAPCNRLIVVKGFTSVWWLNQNGFGEAVATMGPDCSDEQASLITSLVAPGGRIWIIPDGDEDGARLAQSLLSKLATKRFVRWLKLGEGRRPQDLPVTTLKNDIRF